MVVSCDAVACAGDRDLAPRLFEVTDRPCPEVASYDLIVVHTSAGTVRQPGDDRPGRRDRSSSRHCRSHGALCTRTSVGWSGPARSSSHGSRPSTTGSASGSSGRPAAICSTGSRRVGCGRTPRGAGARRTYLPRYPWQNLTFLPLPHGHRSFRPADRNTSITEAAGRPSRTRPAMRRIGPSTWWKNPL